MFVLTNACFWGFFGIFMECPCTFRAIGHAENALQQTLCSKVSLMSLLLDHPHTLVLFARLLKWLTKTVVQLGIALVVTVVCTTKIFTRTSSTV